MRKEYEKILSNSKTTMNELQDYVYKNFPAKLYRYRRFDKNEYWRDEIYKGFVHMTKSNQLNDPFDCKIYIDNDIHLRKAEVEDNLIYIMIRNDVRRKKSETENLIRIACFSEVNDDILMWSHYSDYHKGFCIEYDISKINQKDYRRCVFPIVYSDNCYDITQEMLDPIKDPIYIKSFLYKYKEWEYEKEWRLVCEENPGFSEEEYKFDFSEVITGIYLGLNASINEKELSELIKWAKKKNINLYKMKADDKQYKLHKEKIDKNNY